MQKKGSITVFLSLVFIIVSALICGLLESARTAGVRFYLQTAADSAIDSVFSNYHRRLWEDYGLILWQCSGEERAKAHLEHYLLPYLEKSSWYRLGEPDIAISDIQYVTDQGGAWFEQEILDFMKYNIVDFEHDPDTSAALLKGIEEAEAMKEISDAYGKHSKEAAKLEKALSKISANLNEQKLLYEEVQRSAGEENTGKASRHIGRIKSNIHKLDNQLAGYIKRADELSRNLARTEEKYTEQWEKLSPENRELLKAKTDSYKEYTEQDGERRRETEQKVREAKENIFDLDEALGILEEIEEWEDEEEEDGEIDMLWVDFSELWTEIKIPLIESAHGIADEEKEEILETAGDILGGSLLELVLPEGREISYGVVNKEDLPSAKALNPRREEEISLLDGMIIDEYACRYFADFTDQSEKEIRYELEYIINGEEKEPNNLSAVLWKILAIREGLNYMHIITDSQKMKEVNTLASTIAGAFGVPGLLILFVCLIVGIWALGESVLDLRSLLAGKKVPIFKTAEDWKLSLDGLMKIGRKEGLPQEEGEGEGIDYQAYLRLLLLTQDQQTQNYRMMDIIETNMRYTEEKFRMRHMIYAMSCSVSCKSERLFSRLGAVNREFFGLSPDYRIAVETLRAY